MLNDIIRPKARLEITYGLRFYIDAGGGCEFPCDKDGNLKINELTKEALKNYEYCINHPDKYQYAFNKVVEYRRRIKDTPHGTCHCGEKVYLVDKYMGACPCPRCGQWYNLFGQELLPPMKWEELELEYEY